MQTRTRLYEILIRFNPDGTSAATQKSILEVLDDNGVVVPGMASVQLPVNVDPTAAAAALGAAQAQVAASISQANSDRDIAQATVTAQAGQIDQLNNDKRNLTATLATVTASWQVATKGTGAQG